jgi:hypothetical protein
LSQDVYREPASRGVEGEGRKNIGQQESPSPQRAAKHESLNAQLAPYAAKIVTVSGTIVTKKGVNVIENAQILREEARWQQNPDRMT